MNKFIIGQIVDYLGTESEVIDMKFDKNNKIWVYDLQETKGDGEYNEIEEDYLTNKK